MSQGALDRITFEAIEAYVLDRMGVEERAAFKQRMAMDPALRAEVELERENIRTVELGGMTRMLKRIAAEEQGEERAAGGWSRYAKVAAVIAVLATGAIWWLTRVPENERLFAAHFEADPGLPVTMGGTDDPAFADAMVSYKEGHYAEARAKWAPLLQRERMNDALRYYIGAAAMAEGDDALALAQLSPIADDSTSTFRHRARWFLFLTYVRMGDLSHARSVDLSADPRRAEEARAMLSEPPR